ncbi:DUF423 domain-containing protein [Marinomonas sp. GJ51-6]|uniref:DUF423 domain-containing protein n=1 Tax=Marinomonas sp. GJ51-6 TaxID=2992802 RepID=UPI002934DB05|nr:DUF423 domain-containing protein [Marinomonas sp. GJ51-6]WOD06125.1 DUF423 domain-containing protein [Marinomonas sp. GJ51-6]
MSAPEHPSVEKHTATLYTKWSAVFVFQAAVSVAAGAFVTHALADALDANALSWWHTGSQYLMYHALAGLIASSLFHYLPSLKTILRFFFVGNILFVGSLYIMSLTDFRILGVVTPLGGTCYLIAWFYLGWSLWRFKKP